MSHTPTFFLLMSNAEQEEFLKNLSKHEYREHVLDMLRNLNYDNAAIAEQFYLIPDEDEYAEINKMYCCMFRILAALRQEFSEC